MKCFPMIKLGEIAKFSQGIQIPIEDQSGKCESDGHVRFIRIVDYTQKTRDIRFVKNPGAKYLVTKSDLVMVRYGPIGVVGRGIEGVIANNLFKVSPNTSVVDGNYLYYCLSSERTRLKLVSSNSSTTMPAITFGMVSDVDVPLPPIVDQIKIAGILSVYDSLIDNNLRRIKILEEMVQSLYREWFVHFRFPGHESVRFLDSPEGRIPKGWAFASLGSICSPVRTKYDDQQHSDRPLLDLSRMPSESLAPSEYGSPNDLTTSRILFQAGDTLFGSIRPYLHKVCRAPMDGVTNVSVFVLRPRQQKFSAMTSTVCASKDVIKWADRHSSGTKMPVIKWEQLREFVISVPPEPILERFDKSVSLMLDQLCALSRSNQNLRRTRDLLLPKLLAGSSSL